MNYPNRILVKNESYQFNFVPSDDSLAPNLFIKRMNGQESSYRVSLLNCSTNESTPISNAYLQDIEHLIKTVIEQEAAPDFFKNSDLRNNELRITSRSEDQLDIVHTTAKTIAVATTIFSSYKNLVCQTPQANHDTSLKLQPNTDPFDLTKIQEVTINNDFTVTYKERTRSLNLFNWISPPPMIVLGNLDDALNTNFKNFITFPKNSDLSTLFNNYNKIYAITKHLNKNTEKAEDNLASKLLCDIDPVLHKEKLLFLREHVSEHYKTAIDVIIKDNFSKDELNLILNQLPIILEKKALIPTNGSLGIVLKILCKHMLNCSDTTWNAENMEFLAEHCHLYLMDLDIGNCDYKKYSTFIMELRESANDEARFNEVFFSKKNVHNFVNAFLTSVKHNFNDPIVHSCLTKVLEDVAQTGKCSHQVIKILNCLGENSEYSSKKKKPYFTNVPALETYLPEIFLETLWLWNNNTIARVKPNLLKKDTLLEQLFSRWKPVTVTFTPEQKKVTVTFTSEQKKVWKAYIIALVKGNKPINKNSISKIRKFLRDLGKAEASKLLSEIHDKLVKEMPGAVVSPEYRNFMELLGAPTHAVGQSQFAIFKFFNQHFISQPNEKNEGYVIGNSSIELLINKAIKEKKLAYPEEIKVYNSETLKTWLSSLDLKKGKLFICIVRCGEHATPVFIRKHHGKLQVFILDSLKRDPAHEHITLIKAICSNSLKQKPTFYEFEDTVGRQQDTVSSPSAAIRDIITVLENIKFLNQIARKSAPNMDGIFLAKIPSRFLMIAQSISSVDEMMSHLKDKAYANNFKEKHVKNIDGKNFAYRLHHYRRKHASTLIHSLISQGIQYVDA